MIYNMRRRKKKPKQLTWRFYDRLSYRKTQDFSANFESAGSAWTGIKVSANESEGVIQMWYLTNNSNPFLAEVSVYTITKGFKNREYRTITFEKEPTGDLLAFLQKNATLL